MSRRRSLEVVMQAELVTVSELVQLSGMRYSTLKYYTEIGILPFNQLDMGLVRRYPRLYALERLEEIRSMKDKGMTIQQIVDHYQSKPVD
jgi:DNA-binding transcriptional MerR regulator